MSDIDRAELRRLLAEAETPWTIEQTTPNMDGPNWLIRREGKAGIIISAHEYGFYGRGEVIMAAVNALPDLLDALEKAEAHRDSLAATLIEVQREKLALERAIERVRALHTCEARWGNEDYSIDADEYAARKAENDEGWDLDTLARFDVCAECYRIERSIEQRDDGVAVLKGLWPCPTIQALDGVMGDE